MSILSLAIPVLIAVAAAGSPSRFDPEGTQISGVVIDPSGAAVGGALVAATTACDDLQREQVGSTETNRDGRFTMTVDFRMEVCSRLRLQASKRKEFWLQTGEWENLVEDGGTAPVIDVTESSVDSITIRLGSRGGRLVLQTVDEAGGFWPSVVSLRRCPSRLPGVNEIWTSTSNEYPEIDKLLPEGTYCVGIVSANRMYPTAPNCRLIQIVAGERHDAQITIRPSELTTESVLYDPPCPEGSRD